MMSKYVVFEYVKATLVSSGWSHVADFVSGKTPSQGTKICTGVKQFNESFLVRVVVNLLLYFSDIT